MSLQYSAPAHEPPWGQILKQSGTLIVHFPGSSEPATHFSINLSIIGSGCVPVIGAAAVTNRTGETSTAGLSCTDDNAAADDGSAGISGTGLAALGWLFQIPVLVVQADHSAAVH